MNVMIDLETLDTSPSAVVLSIGAVAFSDDGVKSGEFYVELTGDLETQQKAGRTTSMSTLLWWMGQGAAAQTVFRSHPVGGVVRMDTVAALEALRGFLFAQGPLDQIKMWANGSDFDNVIMRSLYESFGMEAPWKFYNHRCYRTFKSLPGAPKAGPREGVYHNALADAQHQYVHWTEISAWLRNHV